MELRGNCSHVEHILSALFQNRGNLLIVLTLEMFITQMINKVLAGGDFVTTVGALVIPKYRTTKGGEQTLHVDLPSTFCT